jgi:hypothetical protein
MFRTVKIGDVEVPMKAMASVDFDYRNIFHEDPTTLQSDPNFSAGDLINFLIRMAFVMAKAAELDSRKEMAKVNESMFYDWLDQFDRAAFMDALESVKAVYDGQSVTTSDAKKNTDRPTE